ncbi:MAG TPA: MFS transporter [Gaiellaceae bacterium]|nr:MFS transporter [Gaiellaceae bacterium]HWJ44498.1 MFS transporter [Gaiellaceae bacterium]
MDGLIPERLKRPLRSPSFRRLALGKSISYLGDWLMVAVLVGWVYETTSSVAQVALLMVIRLVPPIVGGGVAASIVDRLPRQRVLVWSEFACAATIAGALVGVLAGSRPLVFAFVGLCGLVGMISTVAGNALIPLVVEEDQLAAANGVHSVGQEAAMALGALAGGATLALGGATAGLAANLASYAFAVVLYARIDVSAAPAAHATRRGGLIEGMRYVLRSRPLTVVVGSFAFGTLAAGLVNATLPKFTAELGLGASGYGWALAALGSGMIAGEALTGAIAERIEPRSLSYGLAGMGIFFAGFAWAGSAIFALLFLVAFGVANGFVEVAMMTAVHQEADAGYQGRVFGVGSTLWRTTMLGAVAFAPVVDAFASPAQAITLAAVVLLAGAALVQVTLRPSRRLATAAA